MCSNNDIKNNIKDKQSKLKMLILHRNDNTLTLRRAIFNFSFCLPKYAPEHEYILHCFGNPITDKLKNEKFDAIIFDVTFLGARWAYISEFLALKQDYSFIANSDAVKIALPQDEYDHSFILDEWLADWKIDIVFSMFPSKKSMIYPKTSQNAEIIYGLTGYVDDEDIKLNSQFVLPFEERQIDVGYRANNLPPNFGRFGNMKAKLGNLFNESVEKTRESLKLDLSNKPEDTLVREDWLKFLGNSKFTLGCESGSSILDPYGKITKIVRKYMEQYPNADFKTIEAACFPEEDFKYGTFSAISPRIFEVAIARSCQILVEGEYLEELKPGEHYILVKQDFSNISEVLEQMKDTANVKRMIDNCYSVLIKSENYNYNYFVKKIITLIEKYKAIKNPKINLENPTSINNKDSNKEILANRELVIEIVNLLSFKDGYGYIPANLTQKELISMLKLVIETYEDNLQALQSKIDKKSGIKGSLKELFGINKFADQSDILKCRK